MNRRSFLKGFAGAFAAGAVGVGASKWPSEGFANPCLPPERALDLEDPILRAALEGLDWGKVWDAHAHIAGTGDSGGGLWANPKLFSPAHPLEYAQKEFYLDAACSVSPQSVDEAYVRRLLLLSNAFPEGFKTMLFAFDRFHSETGEALAEKSHFFVPNDLAAKIARENPSRFEWACSVHPYRRDAAPELERCAQKGARAIKWLPSAQGIDPSSPRCAEFYEAARRLDMPLITHAGDEKAARGAGLDGLGNPLLLREPLRRGVRVVVAHCASEGEGEDRDRGGRAPNFELFGRLMREREWEGRLFADVSAISQVNRSEWIRPILAAPWKDRLLNGSDYPLPGVMPLFDPRALESEGLLPKGAGESLSRIRRSNALLFDFCLKRSLRWRGESLPAKCFETRDFFDREKRNA